MTPAKIISTLLGMTLVALLCLAPLGSAQAKAVEGAVNINTASVHELTLLPGIGKSKAEQIVQLRQAKPFASVDDLKAIKGLGAKRLEAMRPYLAVSGETTAKAIKTPKAPAASSASSPAASPKI